MAREAAAEPIREGVISVEKEEVWSEKGKKYGITMTPTTVINGEKAAVGKVLETEALKGWIDRLRNEFND